MVLKMNDLSLVRNVIKSAAKSNVLFKNKTYLQAIFISAELGNLANLNYFIKHVEVDFSEIKHRDLSKDKAIEFNYNLAINHAINGDQLETIKFLVSNAPCKILFDDHIKCSIRDNKTELVEYFNTISSKNIQ